MLDGVVEHKGFGLSPIASFASDPKPAALGDDQRQVADQAGIVDPDMGGDGRIGREQREHRVGRRAAHLRLVARCKELQGLGAVPSIGVNRLTILEEMDRGPIAAPVEGLPLVEWLVFRILDVGHQLGMFSRHNRLEFRRYFIGGRFQLLDPRKAPAGMKFMLGERGIVKMRRLTVVSALLPENIRSEPVEAAASVFVGRGLGVGHGRPQPAIPLVLPLGDALLTLGDGLSQGRWKGAGRLLSNGVRPGFGRFFEFQAIEEAGPHQEGGEVARFDHERPMNGLECKVGLPGSSLNSG